MVPHVRGTMVPDRVICDCTNGASHMMHRLQPRSWKPKRFIRPRTTTRTTTRGTRFATASTEAGAAAIAGCGRSGATRPAASATHRTDRASRRGHQARGPAARTMRSTLRALVTTRAPHPETERDAGYTSAFRIAPDVISPTLKKSRASKSSERSRTGQNAAVQNRPERGVPEPVRTWRPTGRPRAFLRLSCAR